MAGFTSIISKNTSLRKNTFRLKNVYGHEGNYSTTNIAYNNFSIEYFTNKKFENDKTCQEDNDFIIGIEGVILNLNTLRTRTNKIKIFDVIKTLYLNHSIDFVKELRGDFSGFIYSKKEDKWEIFTNPIGSKRVFYYHNDDLLIFASELRDLSYILHENSIDVSLNIEATYLLLTYGYMIEDITLINGVKRLTPGTILRFENDIVSTIEYFNLKNIQATSDSHDQIIEKMDVLFSNAIRLEFEKDKEYGYKHIATLSGGLDSRMTVLMAHKLGYIDQLNFTFSQSNYLDELISKKIASDYNHEFLFQSLDNGNYLKDIDKTTYYNDGLITYSGSAHLMKSIENMNFNEYGLFHTGMIGDAVIGSFLSQPTNVKPSVESGAYSTILLHRISPFISEILLNYENEELFKFYGRAFSGALNGNLYLDIFSQTVSPFLELEFLSYCYSIPAKYKYKQKIYLEWIAAKHPEFANYAWEKTGISPLKTNSYKKYLDIAYYKRMSLKFFDKLSGKINSGMNPFDYWMAENADLRNTIHNYFKDNIGSISKNSELLDDVNHLFNNGTTSDKLQVLTLLAAIKLHGIHLS